ncbi:MAG TPA: M13 family metallopeptidase [Rhizomicrobium sp.]|jgi:putative endopeptidase|nr:M13 family metallopeptidase [Rhizomicrobium sp.]
MNKIAILAGTCVLALTGVVVAQTSGKPAVPPWGVDLSMMDTTVRPGNDFFLYANGTWMKHDVIPADRSYSGVNLELDKQNEARLKGIVEGLRNKPDLTGEDKKLRDFYAAFEDQKQIDANGKKPVQADLAMLAGLKTLDGVARAMGTPELQLDGPFGGGISVDQKDPTIYRMYLGQSGLGMPDRDYYLKTDKAIAATQAAYKKYIVQMLGFAGIQNADAREAAVYQLEHDIAVASWPAEDRRDAEKTYNPTKFSDLKKLAPQFPWAAYFAGGGLSQNSPHGERVVIVAEKSAFPKLAAVFAATPVAVWRDYLTVRYMHSYAAYLPHAVDDADFAFYGKAIQGKTQQLDRETRGVQLLDNAMGEALGKLYVAKYFSPEAKAKAETLVRNLLAAYDADISTLTWMTPATREKAREKLHHYMLKVGYPDHWRDYSALAIDRDNLVGDVKAAAQFEWHRNLVRIDSPVDRTEWGMTPPTNNAYYNPVFNEIVFPAGILQPPFFDPNADDAVNYGEIGATIGHEISHGFDDQGSKYDAFGSLKNWWTDADRKNFDARTNALARQYDQYEPLPGLHINGKLTLGENIADLAGLVIAYKAYHIALGGKPAPVLNGYTGDQRFYIAYSQSWRQHDRDGIERARLLSNPHSPENYRVNGVVRNDDGWYASFPDIKPGDKYYLPPDQRVKLW